MDLANKSFLATIALLLYNVSSHAQATSSTVITNEKQPNDLHLMVIYALIAICIVFVTLLIKSWINTKHLKEKLILTGANIPELAEGKIILETLPIGIAIYNKDGVREYYNNTIANIFKVYDTHIYKGKHSVLFDDPAISNDVKKQILEGEDIDSIFEYDLNKTILKDSLIDKELSHTLFLNIRVRYIKDNNGTIEKYIVIVTDITKRWLYDLQLQRSKQYLNLALEVGGVTVWYYDIKQSHFYNINNEVSLEEGTTLDEIKATLQDRHREIFSETINNLLSQKIKEGEYIHKDKNDNYFKTKIISVFDKDGNLEKLIGSHKDITEYYQQKQTLEENKNTTELAIKTSNLVQWGYDCKTGVFDAVNEVIKTDKPYLVAEDYLRIAHPDDYNLVYSFIKQMQERLDIDFSYDARMRLPGFDKWQYVTIDGKSIKDRDGNIIKYTGFRRNNTKLVELNKQLNMKNIHMNMI
ncbi:MAG: PAS domain-containing protein, partial [Rikenellaceae bacterium]